MIFSDKVIYRIFFIKHDFATLNRDGKKTDLIIFVDLSQNMILSDEVIYCSLLR